MTTKRFLLFLLFFHWITLAVGQKNSSSSTINDAYRTDYGDAEVADPQDFAFYAVDRNVSSTVEKRQCSAILIHPDVLLIARNCASTFESNDTKVVLLGNDGDLHVESVLRLPFTPFNHLLPQQVDLDLALVKLANTSKVSPAKLPEKAVKKGDVIYKIGYGSGNFDNLPPYDQLLKQKFVVSGVGEGSCAYAGDDKYFCVAVANNNTMDSCVNDVGGALVDDNGTIIGIGSGIGPGSASCNVLFVDVHHLEYFVKPGICYLSENKPSDCDPFFFESMAPSTQQSSLAPSTQQPSLAPSTHQPSSAASETSGGTRHELNMHPKFTVGMLLAVVCFFLY